MRILTLHNRYRIRGGEDESAESEVMLMRQHGHEVFEEIEDNRSLADSDRWRVGRQALWNHKAYQQVRSLIRSFKPHLVKIHNFFPLLSPSVIYATVAEGVPVVQALHNFRLLCPGAGLFRDGRVCEECLGRRFPWPGLLHGCYRQSRAATAAVAGMSTFHRATGTWNRVNLFVTPSHFARKKFEEAGLPAERIRVKPNFLACDPQGGGRPNGYAVFAGRLAPEKGLQMLIAAWRMLKDPMPLKVVGHGPLFEDLTRQAIGCPGIEFIGFRTIDEVLELMGGAHFSVVPSEWPEVFGRVVIESFAKGTPVIASNIGALPELVDHGRTGLLFRPGDPEDLAAKIDWFLSHPAEAARMRREARAEFLAKYTAERNYQMLMEIYESVLAGKQLEVQPAARAARAAGHAD